MTVRTACPRRVILSEAKRNRSFGDHAKTDENSRRLGEEGICDGYGDSDEVDPCVAALLGFVRYARKTSATGYALRSG